MREKVELSRKEKAIQTRNKIYESAEQLFSQDGFENVSVDKIVKHAGVAKGSFYVHFESKDALISILINDHVNQVDQDYKSYLESLSSDKKADEILLLLVGKIADVITNHIGHERMAILYRVQLGNDMMKDKAAIDYNRELYTMFHDIIQRGIEKDVFYPQLSGKEIARQ
ncbi:MAG: TetR/AcrR family transcriptional regulator, partial [Fastidiosipila sp.]|nr:TetR/AcrR family transcriptional regulator [Fastidiosipila sp.]